MIVLSKKKWYTVFATDGKGTLRILKDGGSIFHGQLRFLLLVASCNESVHFATCLVSCKDHDGLINSIII